MVFGALKQWWMKTSVWAGQNRVLSFVIIIGGTYLATYLFGTPKIKTAKERVTEKEQR